MGFTYEENIILNQVRQLFSFWKVQEKNLRLFYLNSVVKSDISQLERVSILLPRRKLPVPKGSPREGLGGGGALKKGPSNILITL
jgi:hypothetical protein